VFVAYISCKLSQLLEEDKFITIDQCQVFVEQIARYRRIGIWIMYQGIGFKVQGASEQFACDKNNAVGRFLILLDDSLL
jgi:hypothetical protein